MRRLDAFISYVVTGLARRCDKSSHGLDQRLEDTEHSQDLGDQGRSPGGMLPPFGTG
jgi:hypothetical protein